MAGARITAGRAVTAPAVLAVLGLATIGLAMVGVLAGCAPAGAPAGASPGQTSAGHHGTAEVIHGGTPDGTVTGRFVREGGPLRPGGQQPAVPLAGTITFRAASGAWLRRVRVGKSGRFSVALPPGRFTVSGRSPAIAEVTSGSTVGPGGQVTGGTRSDPPCSAPLTVHVIAGHTTAARLVCPVP
jgi:hypothetical protein